MAGTRQHQITDYVHYHWDKYRIYGINQNTGNNDIITVVNKEKSIIKKEVEQNSKGINEEELNYLKEALNYCFDLNSAQKSIRNDVKNTYNEIWDEAMQQMIDEFNLALGQISKTGNVSTYKLENIINDINNQTGMTLKKLNENSNSIIISDIEQRIKGLNQLTGQLETYIGTNPQQGKNLQDFKIQLNNIQGQFDNIKQSIQKASNDSDIATKAISTIIYGDNDTSSLVQDINALLAIFDKVNARVQKGALGEYLVADAQGMLQYTASKAIYEEVKKMGDDKIYDNINITKLFPDFTFNEQQMQNLGLTYDDKSKNIIIKNTLGKKQKIDVQYTSKQNNMKISVKNYNFRKSNNFLYNNISILSGNLLSAFISLNNNNFVNHYLNLASARGGSYINNEASIYQDLKMAMKEALLWQGLTGYFKEGTNVLVVINNQRKKNSVEVISMQNLFNQILNENSNINERLSQSTILINNEPIDTYTFENTFIRTHSNKNIILATSERIMNLFKQIRVGKIQTQISKDLFSEIN